MKLYSRVVFTGRSTVTVKETMSRARRRWRKERFAVVPTEDIGTA